MIMMIMIMITMTMMMKLHLLDRCVKHAVPVEGRNSKLGKVNILEILLARVDHHTM